MLSLTDLCLGVEKKIVKINDAHGHALTQEHLPGGNEIKKKLVDPSLVTITIHLICLIHASEYRKEEEKSYCIFTIQHI